MTLHPTPLESANAQLSNLFVLTPSHEYALNKLQMAVRTALQTSQPSTLVLTGNPGTGKSETLNQWESAMQREYAEAWDSGSRILKVLTPESATPAKLAEVILEAGGDILPARESSPASRVFRLVQETRPIAISLDEYQHLCEQKTIKQSKQVEQNIKNLFNLFREHRIGVAFILSGTSSIRRWLGSSQELQQRFANFASLPTYSLADPKHIAAFREILEKVREIVPFAQGIDLTSQEMTLRMLLASEGVLRTLVNLNRQACLVAQWAGDSRVSLEHLAQAFEDMQSDVYGRTNPFDLKPKELEDEAATKLQKIKRAEAARDRRRRKKQDTDEPDNAA